MYVGDEGIHMDLSPMAYSFTCIMYMGMFIHLLTLYLNTVVCDLSLYPFSLFLSLSLFPLSPLSLYLFPLSPLSLSSLSLLSLPSLSLSLQSTSYQNMAGQRTLQTASSTATSASLSREPTPNPSKTYVPRTTTVTRRTDALTHSPKTSRSALGHAPVTPTEHPTPRAPTPLEGAESQTSS